VWPAVWKHSASASGAPIASLPKLNAQLPGWEHLMHVEPRDGESFDQLLRRFKTTIDKSGILRE
jgi:hypothetical protein